jgi:hypothetical protein
VLRFNIMGLTMLNEKPARVTAIEPGACPSSRQRDRDTRWKKGQSGNPRGRPKSDFTLQALAQQYSVEGLERLVAIMRDEKTKPETVATVVGMIWDRGFGKAPASLAVKQEMNISDQFEQFIRELGANRRADMREHSAPLTLLDASYAPNQVVDGEPM